MMINNAEKYFFQDFTRHNYLKLLKLAKKNYHFVDYKAFPSDKKLAVLRHDLDFSVQSGLKLAQIEASEGISATYFLLMHSEFYNLLESSVTKCVREILALGHKIGLHFDPAFYRITEPAALEKYLSIEKHFLENIFDQEINVFSFHITNHFTEKCVELHYANMINVYSSYFKEQVGYCSDSNGYWRHERLETVLTQIKPERLQILIHPEYWQETVMSPRQRVWRCIEGRAENTKSWYKNILKEYQREDIDW